MARKVRRIKVDPTATSGRRRLAIIGLIAFLVIDVLLVAWASTAARTPRVDSGAPVPSSVVSPTVGTDPTPRPTPTATQTPVAPPVADAVAPTRLLAVLDDSTAWRATTGPCPATPAVAELTTDGGATWKQSDASGATGASSLVRLTVQSARQASAVALASSGCTPEFIRTYIAGDNWAAYADQLGSSWYVNPANTATVHSPSGDAKAPCPAVVGLAVGSNSGAAVLCANHDVYRTADGGATWGTAQQVTAAVAITAADAGYVVASVGAEGCAGTAISSLDAGTGAPSPVACVGSTAPAAGTVTVGAGSGALWLWAGDAVVRSTDGGKTWR